MIVLFFRIRKTSIGGIVRSMWRSTFLVTYFQTGFILYRHIFIAFLFRWNGSRFMKRSMQRRLVERPKTLFRKKIGVQ